MKSCRSRDCQGIRRVQSFGYFANNGSKKLLFTVKANSYLRLNGDMETVKDVKVELTIIK